MSYKSSEYILDEEEDLDAWAFEEEQAQQLAVDNLGVDEPAPEAEDECDQRGGIVSGPPDLEIDEDALSPEPTGENSATHPGDSAEVATPKRKRDAVEESPCERAARKKTRINLITPSRRRARD